MKLTRIQMVVYLQAVDLFTYCTAEQMVRIAAIARQQRFKANEKIYASNDPADAMYCVAEGTDPLLFFPARPLEIEIIALPSFPIPE